MGQPINSSSEISACVISIGGSDGKRVHMPMAAPTSPAARCFPPITASLIKSADCRNRYLGSMLLRCDCEATNLFPSFVASLCSSVALVA